MLKLVHQLSAFFFYVLGLSFFGAYILLRNGYWGIVPSVWLQAADLPFAFCAVLYGGLSLYVSLHDPAKPSRALAWGIAVPLGIVFIVLVVLNFWGLWPFNG
jgi:hypothetical protein